MDTTTVTLAIHPFERAGLGKTPFKFIGMIEQDLRYGEAILNRAEYQATGIALTTKPGGSCDYCGTYIVNMYRIRGADGREFKVGCDCVARCGDKRLVKEVTEAKREFEKAKRTARNEKRKADRKAGPASLAQISYAKKLGATDDDLREISLAECSALIDRLMHAP